jgi:hypothetical protein
MKSLEYVKEEKKKSIKKLFQLWVAKKETSEKAKMLMVKNPGLIKNQKGRGKPK